MITTLRFVAFLVSLILPFAVLGAEEEETTWEFSAEANLYLIPDETFFNPVLAADRDWLHLEVRYNDEDIDTGSVFAGYNFQAGQTVELNLTPIFGLVFGNSDGVAPGGLLELNYNRVSFTSEFEYFFSFEDKESNFFYAWSELSYSPKDWIWFGIAGQRTRAYETDLDIQRGFLVGFGYGNLEVTGYVMNPGSDDAFGLISFGYSF